MQILSSRFHYDTPQSLAGCLLVASPSWEHADFQKAVCLVVHHSPQGAVGVILNRTLPFDDKLLWKVMGHKKKQAQPGRLHLGGPNSGPVVAMHQREDLAEFVSGEGVYFAAQAHHLKSLIADTDRKWKIFVGQATWEAGSLEQQFSQGCWLPIEVSRQVVFADVDLVWPLAVRQVGNRMVQCLTGAIQPPSSPLMN